MTIKEYLDLDEEGRANAYLDLAESYREVCRIVAMYEDEQDKLIHAYEQWLEGLIGTEQLTDHLELLVHEIKQHHPNWQG